MRWRAAWLWVALALAAQLPAGALAAPDLVFRVPEVRHAAAAKPVGTGRSNGTRNGTEPWPGGDVLEVRYEEYYVEHEVSTAAAREAARTLDVENVWTLQPGCGACSAQEMQYCEWRVLADHCCCERRRLPEPLPWLPHTCYVGARRCKPLAKNCVEYTLLRDCCCSKKLAERWKGILTKSSGTGVTGATLLLVSLVLLPVVM